MFWHTPLSNSQQCVLRSPLSTILKMFSSSIRHDNCIWALSGIWFITIYDIHTQVFTQVFDRFSIYKRNLYLRFWRYVTFAVQTFLCTQFYTIKAHNYHITVSNVDVTEFYLVSWTWIKLPLLHVHSLRRHF